MKILTFSGQDAILMSIASNRQLEVLTEDGKGHWQRALIWRASAVASRFPDRVRLTAPDRTLAESVLGQSIPTRGSLAEQIEAADKSRLNKKELDALALIVSAIA